MKQTTEGFDPEALAARISELIHSGKRDRALAMLGALRPADAADLLESLEDELLSEVVGVWEPVAAAEALGELEPDHQAALAERMAPERLADILDAMPPDDAASFLEEVEPDRRARILGRMERPEAEDVAELLDFPEGSAGRLMSPDFVAVGEEATAQEVIDRLRRASEDAETIYYVYVLGGSNQLKGVVSMRRLIVASPKDSVAEMMETDLITVRPTDASDALADLIGRYNLIAIPVADEFGRMLGIVTVDDVLEEMGEESEQDILRFAGSFEEEEAAGRRAWPALRKRLPWLAAATLIELLIAFFLLRPLPTDLLLVVVAYIPLLVFVGGNTAVQAAARVLVRLQTGQTESWSPWVQTRKEIYAGLVLAVFAAGLSLPILILLGRGWEFSFVVAVALGVAVIAGAGTGAALPVALYRMKLDPAIASGPLLGSAMDIISLSIYLVLATSFGRAIL